MNSPRIWKALIGIGVLVLIILVLRSPTSSVSDLSINTSPTSGLDTLIDTARGPRTYEDLENEIFQPLGYRIRERTIIPALDYSPEINCPEVFLEWLVRAQMQNESAEPPREIPPDLFNKYTLDGHTTLIMHYADDRSGTYSVTWAREGIDSLVAADVTDVIKNHYQEEGRAVFESMKAYSDGVTNKPGLVIGSQSPWVESFALKLNASHVRTVEYLRITVDHPKVDYRHPVDLAKEYKQHIGAYDWATSFSSVEHSGIGRYGDALDPYGDLKESQKAYCMLKKGGYYFLGFPIGTDTLTWNLHRVYGRVRLALMLTGFELIDIFYHGNRVPLQASDYAAGAPNNKQYVYVLRKR